MINSYDDILNSLFEMQDKNYQSFQAKLVPSVNQNSVIGVRTPELKLIAKQVFVSPCCNNFLSNLPHKYFEENQLHAFLISLQKDFDICISQLEKFLPYIDNWATCDQLSPVCFKKRENHTKLLPYIREWIKNLHVYTCRFAIKLLMQHFLDEDFSTEYLELVSTVKSSEYYINMMIAWYYATALAKQWDSTIGYIEQNKIEQWTHNKTIQKAIESYRITEEQKTYLRQLKRM